MDREKSKRAREDDGVEIESSFESYSNAKKRNVYGISFTKYKSKLEEKDCFKACDPYLEMGVFDFPWLKDGVISKSYEGLDFEDKFSSSLERQDSLFKDDLDFSEECGLCEAPETSMAHIQETKLVEDMWQPFEDKGSELEADGDCIWSFLHNKPL